MKDREWRTCAAALVALLMLSSAHPVCTAQTPQQPANAVRTADAVDGISEPMRWLERELDVFLELPATWSLSTELRQAAEALVVEVKPGIRNVLREWVREIHASQQAQLALDSRQREFGLYLALDWK